MEHWGSDAWDVLVWIATHVRLGDLGSWLSAGGTLAAVWVALAGLRRERRHRLAEQIRGVAAWTYQVRAEDRLALQGVSEDYRGWCLVVQNTSAQPLFDVTVMLPGDPPERFYEPVVAPETRLGITLAKTPTSQAAELRFRDAVGTSWRLDVGREWQADD